MSGAPIGAGRLELMLTELRLPTVRRRRVRRLASAVGKAGPKRFPVGSRAGWG